MFILKCCCLKKHAPEESDGEDQKRRSLKGTVDEKFRFSQIKSRQQFEDIVISFPRKE